MLDPLTEADVRRFVRRKDFAFTPEYLIKVLETPRNKGEIYWTIVALRGMKAQAAVPALKKF